MATNEALLAKVKTSIRIKHNVLDEDVADNIDACLADLRKVGILESKLDTSAGMDPLILHAVKLFCKAEYTDDPAKAARFREGYDGLKSSMMLTEEYIEEAVADV